MKSLIYSFLLFFPLLAPATATVEGRESGGGDLAAIQFKHVAEDLVRAFEQRPAALPTGVCLPALREKVRTMLVESTENPLFLGGLNKDAINYPAEGRIVFHRQRWAMVNQEDRRRFVLHEVLGLLRASDDDYHLSNTAVRAIADMPSTAPYALLTHARCFVIALFRAPEGLRTETFNTRVPLAPAASSPEWFAGRKTVNFGEGRYALALSVSASPYGYHSNFGFQGNTVLEVTLRKLTGEGQNLARGQGNSDTVANRFELEERRAGTIIAQLHLENAAEESASNILSGVSVRCEAQPETN